MSVPHVTDPDFTQRFMAAVNASAEVIARKDIEVERERADKWMANGRKYDEIRDWLRLCEDTPEGHAEFYRECAAIIFPDGDSTERDRVAGYFPAVIERYDDGEHQVRHTDAPYAAVHERYRVWSSRRVAELYLEGQREEEADFKRPNPWKMYALVELPDPQ